MQAFNEHFGQGTVSLGYVTGESVMPGAAYLAWWAYFNEHAKQTELRKAQTEHDNDMSAVQRALKKT